MPLTAEQVLEVGNKLTEAKAAGDLPQVRQMFQQLSAQVGSTDKAKALLRQYGAMQQAKATGSTAQTTNAFQTLKSLVSPAKEAPEPVPPPLPSGNVNAAMIAAGKRFADAGRAVRGAANVVGSQTGLVSPGDYQKTQNEIALEQRDVDRRNAPAAEAFPISSAIGYELPALPLAMTPSVATSLPATAAMSFAEGVATPDRDPLVNTLVGVGGYKLGEKLTDPLTVRPFRGPSPVEKETVDTMLKHDMYVPPGMRLGDEGLKELDRAFYSNISTMMGPRSKMWENRGKVNQTFAKLAGLVDEKGKPLRFIGETHVENKLRALGDERDAIIAGAPLDMREGDVRVLRGLEKRLREQHDVGALKPHVDALVKRSFAPDPSDPNTLIFTGVPRSWYDTRKTKLKKTIADLPMAQRDAASQVMRRYDDILLRGLDAEEKVRMKTINQQFFFNSRLNEKGMLDQQGNIDPTRMHDAVFRDTDPVTGAKTLKRDAVKRYPALHEILRSMSYIKEGWEKAPKLSMSQRLGHFLQPGHRTASVLNLASTSPITNMVPALQQAAIRQYEAGRPVVTGLLGAPRSIIPYGGAAGGAMARPAVSGTVSGILDWLESDEAQ